MENSLFRLHRILTWQAFSAENFIEHKEKYLDSAFHEVRNLVGSLDRPSAPLLSLLNTVLDAAKYENTNRGSNSIDFSLLQSLTDLEQLFEHQTTAKNLKWISDYKFSSDTVINADQNKLLQILTNLIGNACKFTDSGYVKLSLVMSLNSKISFSVEDTGRGMAEWHLNSLFDEFKQIDNDHNKTGMLGTGLGLPICNSLIASMGGILKVESTLGKGSRFSFCIDYLPVQNAEASLQKYSSTQGREHLQQNMQNPRTTQENGGLPSTNRILLIDDSSANCQITAALLEKISVPCDYTLSSSLALSLLTNLPKDYYSLIITDLHLTNNDGISAAKAIKHYLGFAGPMIIISATERDSLKHETLKEIDEIFSEYIHKPLQPSDFYAIISKYLALSKTTSSFNYEIAQEEGVENILKTVLAKHRVKFEESYNESSDKLLALFEAENFEELRLYAHSLKGLTSTLGYNALASYADAVESLIEGCNETSFKKVELTEDKSKQIRLAIENYNKAFKVL